MMDELDAKIVLAFADNRMSTSATARAIYMHRNSVLYHFAKLKKLTGLDAVKFDDLVKLVQMAREAIL